MSLRARLVLALVLCGGAFARKRSGKKRGVFEPSAPKAIEDIECKKCMTTVMRLLTPAARGCVGGNGTVVPTSSGRTPTAFCETLLPKKRQCIVYSFGMNNVWDFDREMIKKGCRVISFDPFCCGGAHRIGENHDFVPVGLAPYDGITDSDDVTRPNTTYPVMSIRTIMQSYGHAKLDVLRMKVSSNKEWKGLKSLVNTGIIQDVRQLSISMQMSDHDEWEEYKYG